MGKPTFDDPVLIPEEIAKTIPKLGRTSRQQDPVAHVKLFTPDSSWTWYVTELDSKQQIGYGLVYGHEAELGHFSIEEMQSVRGPLGLPIERDLDFKPRPLSQCEDPTHIHENPLKPARAVEQEQPPSPEIHAEPMPVRTEPPAVLQHARPPEKPRNLMEKQQEYIPDVPASRGPEPKEVLPLRPGRERDHEQPAEKPKQGPKLKI